MKILPSALFSLLLLSVSLVLMFVHWRNWKTLKQPEPPQAEYDFRRRQYRRRMLASGMIGLVGIALFIGVALFLGRESLIPWIDEPIAIFVYWSAVFLITLWMALLAFIDALATRRYAHRLSEDHLLEQTKFHAELFRRSRERLTQHKPPSENHHLN